MEREQEYKYVINNMYTLHCARGPLHCEKCLEKHQAGKKFCLLKIYIGEGKEARPIIELNHKYSEFEIVKIFETMDEAINHAEANEITEIFYG